MGQKVDPRGFRIGFSKSWPSEWFAKTKSQNAKFFIEDIKIRQDVEKFYVRSWIGKVVIRKTEQESELIIFTAKPAMIIGKEGKKLDDFQSMLEKKYKKSFKIVIKEIRVPELSAKVMSEFSCEQLEKRMPYRRVAKWLLQRVMDKGAIWVKIQIGWRLGWVDLARSEKFIEWRVPLQTIRSDIDYHYTTALTKYGILWVKVWIYKGDVTSKSKKVKAFDKIQRRKPARKSK